MLEPTEQIPQDTQADGDDSQKGVPYRDPVLLLTLAIVVGIDQLTKYIIKESLFLGESWPSEGFVRITHGTNTGTIFGLLPNQTLLLTIASVAAIGFLIYYYKTHDYPTGVLRFAIGLLLGGAFGNLIDRIASGAVVDFIDVGPWPIFNLADSSIVVGIVIVLAVSARGDRKPDASGKLLQSRSEVTHEDPGPSP